MYRLARVRFVERSFKTYGEKIYRAHDDDDNPRGDDDPPEWQAKIFLTGCLLIEVAEGGVPQQEHGYSEHDETRLGAKERPVSRNVRFEEREFGDD
jgi:hypothetical protein